MLRQAAKDSKYQEVEDLDFIRSLLLEIEQSGYHYTYKRFYMNDLVDSEDRRYFNDDIVLLHKFLKTIRKERIFSWENHKN